MEEKKKGFFSRLVAGLTKTRENIVSGMDSIFSGFSAIDEDFYEELEETLIMGDMGIQTTMSVLEELKKAVKEQHIKDPAQCRQVLIDSIRKKMDLGENAYEFEHRKSVVLVIGVNGVGKTTSIGKLADQLKSDGKRVILAAADTFRAAAIEQLDVWGQRAGVPVIKRDRGSDPASVCYDVLDEADKRGSDLVLIDTAGRLHTSPELMRELAKVVNVTRKRAANMAAGPMPVSVVLVIDAATGQNGLNQALEFNEALGLDGIIMTKLDGTAKGGIAMAVAEKLKLPILRIGVGEQVDDLQEFNAKDFCRALVGESN